MYVCPRGYIRLCSDLVLLGCVQDDGGDALFPAFKKAKKGAARDFDDDDGDVGRMQAGSDDDDDLPFGDDDDDDDEDDGDDQSQSSADNERPAKKGSLREHYMQPVIHQFTVCVFMLDVTAYSIRIQG